MNNYIYRYILLFTLFLSLSVICLADYQEFSLSGTVTGENTAPVLAVNSETGDVLAVWESRGENDISIYSVLVKSQGMD